MGKHIVISINTSWNIYNFRLGLIRALMQQGHQITALAPRDDFSDRLVEEGIRYVPLPMDNKGTSPLNDLRLLARYHRILKSLKPDVFLGFTIKPNIYGSLAAQTLKIPVINNISGLGTAFIRTSWVTQLVRFLYTRALRNSHRIFFQNPDDMALFEKHGIVSSNRCELLPGSGVDLKKFKPESATMATPDDAPVFLLIARLLKDKGVLEYVEAAKLVKQQIPECRFQLLGFLDVENQTAISRDQVNEWVSQGIFEYLGVSDDVREEIRHADCIVLPSYREGTPKTLLEAAAMGKPLIATDVPGCREVVVDGYNGFLCKARDAEDTANAVLKFIRCDETQRVELGRNSRKLAEEKFDENIVIERYLAAIDAV